MKGFRPRSRWDCVSSGSMETVWHATSVRISPMSDSTTPGSPGAMANIRTPDEHWSPAARRIEVLSRRPACEIGLTAPYMHDGSIATLEEVIEHYDRGGTPNQHLDPEIRPLHLTAQEKRALAAFLRTLGGEISEGR